MRHQVNIAFYEDARESMLLSSSLLDWLFFFYPDDKACTFVGTAAYVPPEVLNSSPATFGYGFQCFGKAKFFPSLCCI